MTLDNKKRITYVGLLLLFVVMCIIGLKTLLHSNYMVNMIVLLIFATIGFSIIVGFFLVYLDRIVDWIWGVKKNDSEPVKQYTKKKAAVRCAASYVGEMVMHRFIEQIEFRGITISKVNLDKLSFETDEVSVRFFPPYVDHTGMKFDEVFCFDQATAIYLRRNHSQDNYKGDLVDYVVEQHKLRKGE